jgi:hypothetical protein
MALPLTGILISLLHFGFPQFLITKSIKKYLVLCFVPPLVFFGANFLDFYFSNVSSLLSARDHSINTNTLYITNALYLIGLCFIAYVAPYLIKFDGLRGRAHWDFQSLFPESTFVILGLLSIIIIAFVIYGLIKRRQIEAKYFSILLLVNFLLVLVGGLIMGRVNLRGISYIENATYYFYFTNYLLTLLLIFKLDTISQYVQRKCRVSTYSRISYLAMISIVLSGLMSGFSLLKTLPDSALPEDEQMASLVLFISQNTRIDSGYCYGGSVGDVERLVDDRLLWRQNCINRSQGIPLYLARDNGGNIEIIQFNGIHKEFDASRYKSYLPLIWTTTSLNKPNVPDNLDKSRVAGIWLVSDKRARIEASEKHNSVNVTNENEATVTCLTMGGAISCPAWKISGVPDSNFTEIKWSNGTIWKH